MFMLGFNARLVLTFIILLLCFFFAIKAALEHKINARKIIAVLNSGIVGVGCVAVGVEVVGVDVGKAAGVGLTVGTGGIVGVAVGVGITVGVGMGVGEIEGRGVAVGEGVLELGSGGLHLKHG